MDISRLLPHGAAINVGHHQRAEQERQALAAVALWASGCMAHTDKEANAFQQKIQASFDGGANADRVVSEIATQVEKAGKPSLASFASILFKQAMEQSTTPQGVPSRKIVGAANVS